MHSFVIVYFYCRNNEPSTLLSSIVRLISAVANHRPHSHSAPPTFPHARLSLRYSPHNETPLFSQSCIVSFYFSTIFVNVCSNKRIRMELFATAHVHRRKLLLGPWAQAPPHFYDHGARLYDEPPTFVT